MLAVLGGYGAAALSRWRWATPALVVLTTAFLAESFVRPFPINGMGTLRDYATPEARVYRPARAPAVYQRLAQESDVVLAELPLGQPDYDIRAMFYSVVHHGAAAQRLQRFLSAALRTAGPGAVRCAGPRDDRLETRCASSGASHVIVHEARVAGRPRTAHDGGAHTARRDGDLSRWQRRAPAPAVIAK